MRAEKIKSVVVDILGQWTCWEVVINFVWWWNILGYVSVLG